jgi:hypothetical protein
MLTEYDYTCKLYGYTEFTVINTGYTCEVEIRFKKLI